MNKQRIPEKPKKKTKKYWDYLECRDYIEAKYGWDEREMHRFLNRTGRLDFWSWLIKKTNLKGNGTFIRMYRYWLEEEEGKTDWEESGAEDYEYTPEWVCVVLKAYFDEFAKPEDEELEFYVWW